MIHSLDLNERRHQTRKMLTGILGESFYLVFSSELGLQCHGRLGGMTAVGLSALVRESMPDKYVGPLPAIAIVDDRLRDGTYSPEGSAMVFDAFALHEISHIVASNVTANICPELDQESLRDLVQIPSTEWASHAGPLRWAGHDSKFIRALCHVAHRMQSRRHWVPLDIAFCHQSYGLSSAEEYAAALDDECCAMSWLPLSEALGRPMPAKFQKLWTDDVVRSLKVVPVSKGQT